MNDNHSQPYTAGPPPLPATEPHTTDPRPWTPPTPPPGSPLPPLPENVVPAPQAGVGAGVVAPPPLPGSAGGWAAPQPQSAGAILPPLPGATSGPPPLPGAVVSGPPALPGNVVPVAAAQAGVGAGLVVPPTLPGSAGGWGTSQPQSAGAVPPPLPGAMSGPPPLPGQGQRPSGPPPLPGGYAQNQAGNPHGAGMGQAVVAPVLVPGVFEQNVVPAETVGAQQVPAADRAMLHSTEATRTYPCRACGAQLVFDPVGQDLLCPSCGNRSAVSAPDVPVEARELGPAMAALRELQEGRSGPQVTGEWEVKCQNCGGTTGFNGSLTATRCPYCATPIQRDDVHNAPARLPVDGVVPFLIGEKQARELVDKWVSGRWFAPSNFRKYRRMGAFSSLYTAYFTYDADTASWYQGERGDDYQVRVGTDEDGDPVYETRTRWHHVAGEVSNEFAELPVLANDNLNRDRVRALEPWPVERARAYSPEFVAGHLCRTYDTDAEQSFPEAQQRIESAIESTVRSDIGGDHQRIHQLNTSWNRLAYKHLLLPIWLLTVVYLDKPYQVYINGLTGEVSGDRPWSKAKIIAAVLAVLAVIAAVIGVYAATHRHHTPAHPTGPGHSTVAPPHPTTHR